MTDLATVLSAEDRRAIEPALAAYEAETLHQIAVLTLPTLSGESIESYSLRVANTRGIGQKGIDNGILVTVAVKDRVARIELGLGMERYIPDSVAKEILLGLTIPAFRRGEFCQGLRSGLDELMSEARRFRVSRGDAERVRKSRDP